MIPLAANERVMAAFEVKASNHGRGLLYMTTRGVAFESLRYGLVIDVSFEWMRSYAARKNDRFELIWDTPSNQRFQYGFKLDFAARAFDAYAAANKQYADSASEVESIRNAHKKSTPTQHG